MSYLKQAFAIAIAVLGLSFAADSANAQLPKTTVQIERANTALVVIDPQIDFLSPKGVTWNLVGKNVEANHTVENLETLFKTAKANKFLVVISPHYYYPWDHK